MVNRGLRLHCSLLYTKNDLKVKCNGFAKGYEPDPAIG